ncbi:alpha-N-acetylgalactosaminide alpha-2,6-sialyltransferase 1-like [Polypterus senegalus]|uniref:alpha-N-acetylgalactosaminide alpha-2,6-sialyltransferase 1-like n=1 Tax=Polypterus senegalus TaxID=55291 RepID=UPI001964F96A|nr:alpha-N-acetylgalactosaminide alpha-2,6-sialyltransferase 1-like [Polypterus senegalus]
MFRVRALYFSLLGFISIFLGFAYFSKDLTFWKFDSRTSVISGIRSFEKKQMICVEVDEEVFYKNIGIFLKSSDDQQKQPPRSEPQGNKPTTQKVVVTTRPDVQNGKNQKRTPVSNHMTTRKPYGVKDFTLYPVWPDEEEYHRDPVVENWNCPVNLRKSEVSWFKEAFIPNVGFFMHKEHFNEKEWRRLEKFNPPYGWMGADYKDVKEAVEVMPSLTEQKLLLTPTSKDGCIRCAAVGNGGILNGSRKGQEIDSHDYVFRVNGAIIKGFETDVGSKTSFYVHTAHTMTASLYVYKKDGFTKVPVDKDTKFILLPEGRRDYEWMKALYQNTTVSKGYFHRKRPATYFGDHFTMDKYFVIHPDFSRYLKNRFFKSKTLKGKSWAIYRPTTGAFGLMLALHMCDVVNAYGYITENYKNYSDHYYDKEYKKTIFYSNHDYGLEIKLWKMFHDAKIFNLYHKS